MVFEQIESYYRPLFITLAFTGARPNELLALRWDDENFAKEQISISKGRVRGAEGEPKTKSAIRTIPMLPRVAHVLSQLRQQPVISSQGYVFTGKKGQPISKHLDRIWTRALKRAGLRHRPSYQLRHTFATHCIVQGLPLPYIAKLLGHSTIDTLIRHYTGWIDSATKSNDEKLRGMFMHCSKPATGQRGEKVS